MSTPTYAQPMIAFSICDADIRQHGKQYIVVHPSNGAILAYCQDLEAAKAVRDAINDLPRQLRGQGWRVA